MQFLDYLLWEFIPPITFGVLLLGCSFWVWMWSLTGWRRSKLIRMFCPALPGTAPWNMAASSLSCVLWVCISLWITISFWIPITKRICNSCITSHSSSLQHEAWVPDNELTYVSHALWTELWDDRQISISSWGLLVIDNCIGIDSYILMFT